MNIAKNMEFVFIGALVVAINVSNAFATAAKPVRADAKPAAAEVAVQAPAPVATVVVVGKRLTSAHKAKRLA
jgi:hypothetical protein